MSFESNEETWHTEGSEYIGSVLHYSVKGVEDSERFAKVMGWVSASESDFKDTHGNPAPLYKIKYLEGLEEKDLEDKDLDDFYEVWDEYEVRNSLHSKKKRKAKMLNRKQGARDA